MPLFLKHHVFFYVHDMPLFLFNANNTPTRVLPLFTNPLQQEFFGVFLFSLKTTHDPMFSQGFLGNQSFITK